MLLLTETVLLHWDILYQQSQNTAKEGFTSVGNVKDWVDKLASANPPAPLQHSPFCPSATSVDEPDQSLCPPPSKRARTSAPQRLGSGAYNKYINFDLPPGAITNNVWQRVYIPTLVHLSSTCENPWKGFPDDILLETLQQIWDTVYKDSIPHSVVIGGPVYSISMQSLNNWRGGFAAAAVAVMATLFASNRKFENPRNCAAFADAMLRKKRFLFSNNEGLDPKAWTGLWRSPFILRTFAHHFNFAQGNVEVLNLPFEQRGPRGALALACAAVDRVLTLVKNDQLTFKAAECVDTCSTYAKGARYEFDEGGWGTTTLKYLAPIQCLLDEQFQMVVDATLPLVKCDSSPGVSLNDSVDDDY